MILLRTASLLVFLLLACAASLCAETDQSLGPAYLVYAGPYSSSPSSAFGHMFLVLQPTADTPLPMWDVVSFSAETHDASPVRWLFIGITGGFLGVYETNQFHERVREYEALDDRDLWLVRLRLSEAQRVALQEAAAKMEGERFPYTFFSKNCAYYLQCLLAQVLPDMPAPSGPESPMEVLELVAEVGLSEASYYRPSLSRHLAEAARLLQPSTAIRLRRDDWQELASDQEWLRGLLQDDRMFMQEFFNMKALHVDALLDERTQDGMALLRVLVASETDGPTATSFVSPPGRSVVMPDFHPYGKFTLSSGWQREDDPRIEFRYRPAMHEFTDPWSGYRPINTLELLTVAVSSSTSAPELRLEEMVIFSQRSLPPMNSISKATSWLLEAGVERGGIFGPSTLHMGIRAGWGRTAEWARAFHFYLLATGAVIGTLDDGLAMAPGFQAGALCFASGTSRCGVQWDLEIGVLEKDRPYSELDTWVHRDIGRNWGVTLHYLAERDQQELKLDLSWFH